MCASHSTPPAPHRPSIKRLPLGKNVKVGLSTPYAVPMVSDFTQAASRLAQGPPGEEACRMLVVDTSQPSSSSGTLQA